MKRWMQFFFSLLVLTGPLPLVRADGLIVVDEMHWHPPGPWPHPGPWQFRRHRFAPLEVSFHHVTVRIDGQIATTSVDQEFYNPNPRRVEGTYLFPIPKGAHIDKFTMEIGGKNVDAELLPADKARNLYEDIVRKLRDPALLEYAGRDAFKVRIFPIEPRGKKRVKLSYSEALKSDSGLVRYRYPLNTEKFSAKPLKNVNIRVELQNPNPLRTIYSPSHDIEIQRTGAGRASVSYEAANVQPDTDFELYFAPEQDELGLHLLTFKPKEEDGYFLLLASPGADVSSTQILAKDVAFVLDTSGSMAGQKLDQAKRALRFCIENLNAEDRFTLIRFSTEVESLFDGFVTASREHRASAQKFIDDLKAIGGTAINDALQSALSLRSGPGDSARPFLVVFLTDGQPTVGITGEETIVSNVRSLNDRHTRIFCFGIGADVNTHLLDKITEATRAASDYILPQEDIELKVSAFFSKVANPVMANPALKFSGNIRASKLYPSPLPDLFKGEQLMVVGRYSGSGGVKAIIEGAVSRDLKRFSQDVEFSNDAGDSEFIARLWATRRVGHLLDEIRLHGESAELRDEVSELARKHGIVTPYTAYLIVEDEARRGVPAEMQSLQQWTGDSSVRTLAADNWSAFKAARSGEPALAGARSSSALRSAAVPEAALSVGIQEAGRALGVTVGNGTVASVGQEPNRRLVQYTQQSQFVNGKNFFLNQAQWLDATVQKFQAARRVQIEFNSPEYFELSRQEPDARPWLALGQNVQFVLNGVIYDIRDGN